MARSERPFDPDDTANPRTDRDWNRLTKRYAPPVIRDDGTIAGDGLSGTFHNVADVHDTGTIEENDHAFAAWAPVTAVNEEAHVMLFLDPLSEADGDRALLAAQEALRSGASGAEALAAGTRAVALRGTKRDTVVRMLDAIGLHEVLGVGSCSALWADRSDLLHTAYVGVYPIFGGEDEPWGSDTDFRHSLVDDLRFRTVAQLRRVRAFRDRKALLVPMGRHARRFTQHLIIDELVPPAHVVPDLPYPSAVYAAYVERFIAGKGVDQGLPRQIGRDHVEMWAAKAGLTRQ